VVKLPRRADHWLARHHPNLYELLWYWGMVRNEPPEGKIVDHSECVEATEFNARAHTHEGQTGFWLWPDEVGKGLYEDSPTGA